jgi:fucose permease
MRQNERAEQPARGIIGLCLAGYFLIGSVAVLLPSILPLVIQEFDLTLATAGRIFPVMAVGSLIGGMLAGIGSDRFGRRPYLVGSALLVAAGLLLVSFAQSWMLFVGGFLGIGIMQGALSITINALVLDLNARRQGRAVNTLHGLYSLGATISPLLIGWALGVAAGWRLVLLGTSLVWLVLGVVSSGFRYPPLRASEAKTQRFRWNLREHGILLPLFATAFLYNGVAWSLLGWIKVYVQQGGMPPGLLSSGILSLFYAALTLGRFACAHLTERLGYGKTLLLCGVGATLAYPLVTFSHYPGRIAAGVFFSGLFLSGLYPTAVAYGTRQFPAHGGAISGSMSAALTLGSMLPPWWTGIVADTRSLSFAIGLNYILVVPLLGIGWYLAQRDKTPASGLSAIRLPAAPTQCQASDRRPE